MSKNITEENFTEFDHVYLEVVLTRGVLSEADLILILKQFGLGSFEEYSGDVDSLKDMSYVLVNEVPNIKLLNEVFRVMREDYSDRLRYEEAKQIYDSLKILNTLDLQNLYNKHFNKIEFKTSVNEDDIITLILGEFLKVSKEEAIVIAQENFLLIK